MSFLSIHYVKNEKNKNLRLFFGKGCDIIPKVTKNTRMDHLVSGAEVIGDMGTHAEDKPQEVRYERNFNETIIRSRCSFWTPDKKMEP